MLYFRQYIFLMLFTVVVVAKGVSSLSENTTTTATEIPSKETAAAAATTTTTKTIASTIKENNRIDPKPQILSSSAEASIRNGRVIKFLKEPKSATPLTHSISASSRNANLSQFKRPRLSQKLRPRVDRLVPGSGLNVGIGPGPVQQPGQHLPLLHHGVQRLPLKSAPAADPNILASIRKQIVRRVQNGLGQNVPLRPLAYTQPALPGQPPAQRPQPQQSLRFNYDIVKSANYSPVKQSNPFLGARPLSVRDNELKTKTYYTQFGGVGAHPNSLGPVIQREPQRDRDAFKASPPFNGNAIVRPKPSTNPDSAIYAEDVKQFPLPQQHPQHQLNQHFQQQHYHQATNMKSEAQALLQSQQSVQQQQQQQLLSDTNPSHYSVFEDPEITEHAQMTHNSQHNALTFNPAQSDLHVAESAAAKEAQSYLRFMSSNEYFLPKYDPNYKKLDEEKDLQHYQEHYHHHHHMQQQQQQQPSNQQQVLQHQLPQPQQRYHPDFQYSKTMTPPDAVNEASFQHPIQVSQLFYQQDPSPSSTVVRGSYQTGSNIFVVKSDGNKAVKHIVPSSLATEANVPEYTEVQFNSLRSRTPEPLRFEFTEKDAVPSAYTNSPMSQLRYKSVNIPSAPQDPIISRASVKVPTTITTTTSANKSSLSLQKSTNALDSDPEDDDDMQEAGTHSFGRVPLRTSTDSPNSSNDPATSSPTTTTEQKDTEAYCERICANVQDDDEEIICGSDGYMYTGEAQMECYASCLHISVTIQGKGSCSAR